MKLATFTLLPSFICNAVVANIAGSDPGTMRTIAEDGWENGNRLRSRRNMKDPEVDRSTQRMLRPKSSKSGKSGKSGKSSKSSKSSKNSKNSKTPTPTPTQQPVLDPLCLPGDEDCEVLYENDFENPNYDFSDQANSASSEGQCNGNGGCLGPEGVPGAYVHWNRQNPGNTINLAYGPKDGSTRESFIQDFTVEPVYLESYREADTGQQLKLIDSKTGAAYTRGGNYAIGMLCCAENDKLGLMFDTDGKRYVSFRMDIAAIGLDFPTPTPKPKFNVFAIDSPDGVPKLSGDLLDSTEVAAAEGAPDELTTAWTKVSGWLDVGNSTNGNVTIGWDLLPDTAYASFDNLQIVASNTLLF